ncbi:MAG TPA: GNAT family protein [Baekduia sp.]|nr:GNAT family protein [Baekduia sp.]
MSFPVLHGERVLVRDLREDEFESLRQMRHTPEIVKWWNPGSSEWPADNDDGEQNLAIEIDGELAGHIELYEEIEDPNWRFATLDIFVAPERIGQGYGTEALKLVIEFLIEQRGHHRITIDPAADNTAAIRSYEKAGFRPIGRMEKYWRDGDGVWRDSVFMELVVEPPS